jgi:LysR family transcriptional regulator of abg operon
MELRQLKHLIAVAEAGSLTVASKRVGLTQQALSKSLARLESSIGGKLFDRETRGMALTRLGETVAKHARDVIASTGRLQTAAAAELGLERGVLVVGLSPISSTTWVGHHVTKFAWRHPGLRVDVEGGIDQHFVEELHLGKIDLAIAAQTERHDDSILVQQIGSEPWGIAGRSGHPFLSVAESLADLHEAQWIIGRNTDLLHDTILESFEEAGLNAPQGRVMTTSVLFALTALSGSDFLAILPRSICVAIPQVQWRELSDHPWKMPLYLLRRRRAHLGFSAKKLVSELTAANRG